VAGCDVTARSSSDAKFPENGLDVPLKSEEEPLSAPRMTVHRAPRWVSEVTQDRFLKVLTFVVQAMSVR